MHCFWSVVGQRFTRLVNSVYRETNWSPIIQKGSNILPSCHRSLFQLTAIPTLDATKFIPQRDSCHKLFKILIVSGCFAFFASSALCLEQLRSSWEQLQEETKNRIKKAALEKGTLLTTFGLNLIGQLGQGHERPADRPLSVEALAGKQIVYVAAGDSCTAA